MSSERRVSIFLTEEMRFVANPVIFLSRLFGLFPVNMKKCDIGKTRLKLSKRLAAYSFLITLGEVIYMVFIFMNVYASRDMLGIKLSSINVFITFINTIFTILTYICAFSLTFTKLYQFSEYIRCLREVDAVLPPTGLSYYRSRVNVSLTMVFVVFLSMSTYSICKNPNVILIVTELFWFVGNAISTLNQYSYSYVAYAIYRRIKYLNKNLENVLKQINSVTEDDLNNTLLELHNKTKKNSIFMVSLKSRSTKVGHLINCYNKLCNAVDYVNQIFGFVCVVNILGASFYLLMLLLIAFGAIIKGMLNIEIVIGISFLLLFHLARLLFTIEPCDSCIEEFQETKNLIADLITAPDIEMKLKEEVEEFARVSLHQNVEFHAYYLTDIHRPLITHIIAVLVTYLVVLTQFAETDITEISFSRHNISEIASEYNESQVLA